MKWTLEELKALVEKKRNYTIPNPKSTPKEIAGHHGHRPAGTSILWPALYRHLRAKGMSKRKAAMISNGLWNKRHGKGPRSLRGVKKGQPDARDLHSMRPLSLPKRKKKRKKGKKKDDKYVKKSESLNTVPIVKIDDEKQHVFGWAYCTHDKDGEVNVDNSGEYVDDPEEIEKSAYNFVLHSRNGDADHTNETTSTLIESMVFTKEKLSALGIEEGTIPTGWWVGFHVQDEDVWAGVKKGRYTSFSLYGQGRKQLTESEDEPVAKSRLGEDFTGSVVYKALVEKGRVGTDGPDDDDDDPGAMDRLRSYELSDDFRFSVLAKAARDSSATVSLSTISWGDDKGKICVRLNNHEEHVFDTLPQALKFVKTGKEEDSDDEVLSYAS